MNERVKIPHAASFSAASISNSSLSSSVTSAPAHANVRISGELRDAHTVGDLEKAVYTYIRAIRALGRTRANTSEIANALGITISEVGSTLAALRKKGVKLAT